jgi:hypothetical protein
MLRFGASLTNDARRTAEAAFVQLPRTDIPTSHQRPVDKVVERVLAPQVLTLRSRSGTLASDVILRLLGVRCLKQPALI